MLMTTIISKGFRTDHATPSTLRRYLSLKSLVTSCFRMKRFFWYSLRAWDAVAQVGLFATGRSSTLVCISYQGIW